MWHLLCINGPNPVCGAVLKTNGAVALLSALFGFSRSETDVGRGGLAFRAAAQGKCVVCALLRGTHGPQDLSLVTCRRTRWRKCGQKGKAARRFWTWVQEATHFRAPPLCPMWRHPRLLCRTEHDKEGQALLWRRTTWWRMSLESSTEEQMGLQWTGYHKERKGTQLESGQTTSGWCGQRLKKVHDRV